MIDFKVNADGDLDINAMGDISVTNSIIQAVRIRLKWFLNEWRLGPDLGFPYFQEVFVKNPNLEKIRSYIRETILGVEGVTEVPTVDLKLNIKARTLKATVVFCVGEERYKEEVNIIV